jgi:multidrug efflux pump subunit AcrA (membrane-fusion protein)
MTTREKYLMATGAILGLFVAGILFGASSLVRSEATSAKAENNVKPADTISSKSETAQHESHAHGAGAPSATNQPQSSLQLTEEEQHSIGLQTTLVERRAIRRQLVAAARVEEPETQLANISARIGGRIDKLHVDFTGQPVRRGQAIAELYSPEIVTSAEEYKLALENSRRLGGGAEPQGISAADELVAASRRRLELWGLTPQQIDTIAISDKPQLDFTIYSPASGIITERKVTQGQYVNAGDVLYTVTNLSTVWIKADIYETDLPSIRIGQTVEVIAESLPGTKVRGRVGFLEPMVSAQTRTAVARIQVANPGMRLRPGMFVQTRFGLNTEGRTLVVPRSAVVDTGEHTLVYVAKGNGVFEAQEVHLGTAAGDYFPVLAGLRGSERIVTEGNFLIDSQTRITGGMSGMFGGSKEFDQDLAPQESRHLKVSFRSNPAVPRGDSDMAVYVTVQGDTGKPVTDAQVKTTLFMPAMPSMGMSERREVASLTLKGTEYTGTIKVPTPGTWTVTVEVSRGGQALTSFRTSLTAK